MDEDNLLIICRNCGRKVLMHNMMADGENMICKDCYHKKQMVGSAKSPIRPVESAVQQKKAVKAEKMIKYICTSCRYKFSRKASQQVTKCPYCSKETIVVDSQLGADNLLKESTDKKFDW